MELLALRTFKAVVEEGGILAASRQLNTVQSNVTTRIRRLEEELGTELFFRKGRGLELAPAGRLLLEYAERMLQLERQTCSAIRMLGESSGELRVGSMETFAAIWLPTALRNLRAAHPGLELSVETGTSGELLEKVLSHKLDCAFVGGPVSHEELVCREILAEELVLVQSGSDAGTRETLILFREGCAYRARALSWRRECGQQISRVMELGTLDGILGCVAVGLGVTLMPARVVEMSRYADELNITALPPHLARIPTVMISHRQAPALACLTTLAEAVPDSVEALA